MRTNELFIGPNICEPFYTTQHPTEAQWGLNPPNEAPNEISCLRIFDIFIAAFENLYTMSTMSQACVFEVRKLFPVPVPVPV